MGASLGCWPHDGESQGRACLEWCKGVFPPRLDGVTVLVQANVCLLGLLFSCCMNGHFFCLFVNHVWRTETAGCTAIADFARLRLTMRVLRVQSPLGVYSHARSCRFFHPATSSSLVRASSLFLATHLDCLTMLPRSNLFKKLKNQSHQQLSSPFVWALFIHLSYRPASSHRVPFYALLPIRQSSKKFTKQ
jgi:hypothetical protein